MKTFQYTFQKKENLRQKEERLKQLEQTLAKATAFVNEMKKGKLENELNPLEELEADENHELISNLLELQERMKQVALEEQQRQWASDTLSHFVDLLREHSQDPEVLYPQIIKELTKNVNANQGCLFVVKEEENEVFLEMEACYAYEKRKYLEEKLMPGEGMAGQVYLEKESIYLTEVPDNYVNITSGLGQALPRYIFIVPLKVNDKVYGIAELASFAPFPEYVREFIEKLGENIASTIASARVNARNAALLGLSQEQTQALQAQEEEMRQNMEELSATQEEMQRQINESKRLEKELKARMNVLDKTALLTESDIYGTITYANEKFCKVAKWSEQECVGKPHSIVRHPDNPKSLYKEMWATIKSGKVFQGIFKNRAKDGSTYWVDATIAPVLDEEGKPVKYIGIRYDITEQIEKEEEMKQLLAQEEEHQQMLQAQEEELRQNLEEINATQDDLEKQFAEANKLRRESMAREEVLNQTTILSESDLYGTITFVNDKLCEVSKYSREELIGKPHSIFRHPDMPKEVFKLMWQTIKQGEPFRGIIKNRAKDGSVYWVDAVISPVMDENNKPVKYIGARYVITNPVFAQRLFDEMIDQLKKEGVIQS